MADGRLDEAWEIASHQMAIIANSFRMSDSEPAHPRDFNPRAKPEEYAAPPKKMGVGLLKIFLPKTDPNKTIKPGEL